MNELIPFQFETHPIRALLIDDQPWFCAKDACTVLGYANDSDAIKKHCREAGVAKRDLRSGSQTRALTFINEGNLYRLTLKSHLPAAARFESWVCDEVLPSLRKTGQYEAAFEVKPIKAAKAAFSMMPKAIQFACKLGLDVNAALISANQAVYLFTNIDLLSAFGHPHLKAENQQSYWFTPTELGQRIGVSGRHFNRLLAEAGLQMKQGHAWTPTPNAHGFYRLFDTGKRHGSGTPVTQTKWAEHVLAQVQPRQASA